ncbi:MAG: hypothetical protein PVG89_13505 [Gammaproteobacteria bacterium]|jgi:flagellar basal body-associated protein FliL
MEKRKRHNLLLILAVVILLVGALVQVYLMVSQGEKQGADGAMESAPMESTTPSQQR